ncbi:MAG: hypothetical protein RL148_1105 [Planctomycetota bacterium]|jgi:hypothetical protein
MKDHGNHACPRHAPTRREMLARCASGFGGLAFGVLLGERLGALAPTRVPARAKQVIFLYMDGGPSQVDTFDPKPRLAAEHGKPFGLKAEPTQFNNNGTTLQSPWTFARHGESGIEISSLFPHLARSADRLCVVRSMTSEFSEHTAANYFLHTGLGLAGRPTMGAWFGYGLGTENRDLPGFVVVNGGLIPPGGLDCFSNGFLPATHQASIFRPSDTPIANLERTESSALLQRSKLDLMRRLDRAHLDRLGAADAVESAIANQELAFRMQSAVPELASLDGESEATRKRYGLDAEYEHTRTYARQCLLARRMVERGVRFIEVTCPDTGHDRWDQHNDLKGGHEDNARAVDQPVAALLEDLAERGLLDTTLVVWAGEFGRTPFAQGSHGRDHNPFGYSIWLAGGGVKGGHVHGATDDYGYRAVQGKVTVHDLHATMLHLLGVDHTKLTYRFGGRDMRLTDVFGEVVTEILA